MNELAFARLEPPQVWSLFQAISRVPRCTGKEQRIRAWVREWASSHGIACREDSVGNILLRREATAGWEAASTLVLQAHLDMVCVRAPGATVDPAKDPISLRLEGGTVRAAGTTLGADNGIGVALCLAALSDGGRPHGRPCGPIEALLTVDEEGGFSGALGVKPGFFTGKRLLNLDSEDLGVITIGTAGGEYTDYTLEVPRDAAPDSRCLQITVEGLAGGHSGIDIHRGRLNAIKLLVEAAGCLEGLRPQLPLRLGSFTGGTTTNAIPPAGSLALLVPRGEWKRARKALQSWRADNLSRLRAVEPGIRVAIGPGADGPTRGADGQACSPEDSRRILRLLAEIPHGPLAYSRGIPGLVETSNNLAQVKCSGAAVEINVSCRSCVNEELEALSGSLRKLGERHGAAVKQHSRYPGWATEPATPFVRAVKGCYEEVYGAPVELKAFHAGLECGVFKGLDPELQIASIGPNIRRVHTPQEEVEAASVALIWAVLRRIVDRVGDPGAQEGKQGP